MHNIISAAFQFIKSPLFTIITFSLFSISCDSSEDIIDVQAQDPGIKYMGRIDSTNYETVKFSWSGVSIETIFQGTQIGVFLKDSTNDYNVFIDYKLDTVLSTNSDSIYFIADNLADTLHHFLMTKRTEASFGSAEFGGFILDDHKSKVFLPRNLQKRKIEFLGDSFVAGFGNEGPSPDCEFSRETQNNYYAYGPILARRLNADFHVEAVSGIGIIRNFGDSSLTSDFPFPYYFDKVIMDVDSIKWDFKRWVPEAVVVRLGRNDFWKKPFPSKSKFYNAYKDFINNIRKLYPDAHIFCLCGPIRQDKHCDYIKSVVNLLRIKYKDPKVHFVKLNVNLKKPDDFGCQLHPNINGHIKIADFLEPIIRKEMNWQIKNSKQK